jgi:hypothetical protein
MPRTTRQREFSLESRNRCSQAAFCLRPRSLNPSKRGVATLSLAGRIDPNRVRRGWLPAPTMSYMEITNQMETEDLVQELRRALLEIEWTSRRSATKATLTTINNIARAALVAETAAPWINEEGHKDRTVGFTRVAAPLQAEAA